MSDARERDQAEPAGRLLAVGDIHGCWKPLEAILESVHPTPDDTLVVLGDFINRGPDSRHVVETLIELEKKLHLVTILGNHEEELLAVCREPSLIERWLLMGGDTTLASYGVSDPSEIPSAHIDFIAAARDWWECDQFFFTHASYAAELPLAEQTSLELRWTALNDGPVRPHCSGKTAIVGHSANLQGRVVDFGFLRCLDTGCGLGGCLTMMDIHTRHIWQCGEESCKVSWQ